MSEEKEELTIDQHRALSAVCALREGSVPKLARFAELEAPVFVASLEPFLALGWVARELRDDGPMYRLGLAKEALLAKLDESYQGFLREALRVTPPLDLYVHLEYLAYRLPREADPEKRAALLAEWKRDLPTSHVPLWQSLELSPCHRSASRLFDEYWSLGERFVKGEIELAQYQRSAEGFVHAIKSLLRAGMTEEAFAAMAK